MSSLAWTPGLTAGSLTAQLADRKYIVRADISYHQGKADIQWLAACTMTPGPYLFLTRGLPSREAAIQLCQNNHAESLEVTA